MRGAIAAVAVLLAGTALGSFADDELEHRRSAAAVLTAYGFKGESLQPQNIGKRSFEAVEPTVKSLVPDVKIFRPSYQKGAIRKRIRYGPITLPSSRERNWQAIQLEDSGMSNTMRTKIKQPCTDCTLLFVNAGLEYADGKNANIDTGSWLHHIVLLAAGPGRRDVACNFSGSDPFFASGNERGLTAMTALNGKYKAGYYVKKTDSFSLYSELMNLDVAKKNVWVTLTYEYLPGLQKDYADTRAVWLGLGQCLKQPVPASPPAPWPLDKQSRPISRKPFNVNSPEWVSPWKGEKIFVSGHLHDGGTNISVYENRRTLCDSTASYATKPEFVERSTGIQGVQGMRHISHMSSCYMMGPLKKGSRYYLTARYNFDKHPSMKNNKGKLDEIMGISLLYIGIPRK